jgi:TfoX/Sxy family transcriptional regulator of competence genes
MAYDTKLAERVRNYLSSFSQLAIEEKKMFSGLAFMVNGKMCVNVSGKNLMCRFDPQLTSSLSKRPGFMAMVMKGRELKGYCYVDPAGLKSKKDFEFWVDTCLNFNDNARSSKT